MQENSEIKDIFNDGIQKLRDYEKTVESFDSEKFKMNYLELSEKTKEIVRQRVNV